MLVWDHFRCGKRGNKRLNPLRSAYPRFFFYKLLGSAWDFFVLQWWLGGGFE